MKLFVFPLGQVLLHPGTSKPLNIFEPRYLRMVQDSISEKIPIAVGFIEQPQGPYDAFKGQKLSYLRQVVGYGMPEVLEQRMDGSLMILLPGEGKAMLGEVADDSKPYIIVEATPIIEGQELAEENALSYLNLQKQLVRWIGEHVVDQSTREQFVQALKGPVEVVGAAVSFLVRDPDLQQMILETDDINDKIHIIIGVLSTGQSV